MKDRNKNRPGYKKTKVGWLPEDWEVKPLGSFGLFSKGKGISNREKKETGIPCITYGEIYTKHDFVIKEFYSFIDTESTKTGQKIKKNDILFAGSGETLNEIGKCVAHKKIIEAYAGGDIVIYSPNGVDCIYLSYSLNSDLIAKHRRRLGQGHSVVHIYSSGLKTLHVPFPPLPEQKKIAETLSTWDESIEQMRKLIDAKKRRKKALMQQLLTGKKRFKDNGGNNWCIRPLGELIEPISRPVPKPKKPYLSIGIRSHGKGTFQKTVEQPEKVMMETLYRLDHQDIVVNITFAWEGAIAIATERDEGGLVSHRFPTYRFREKEADIDFFRNLFLTKRFVWDLGLISPGGAGRNRVMNRRIF
ncbi:MAG TPA: restriction endonuclease subunit S [Desulfatiglandales bacterium]|nr:restriction endonuclease subunit S [Desulfatiglandales bacterium]